MFPGWFENFVNICLPKNILINKRFFHHPCSYFSYFSQHLSNIYVNNQQSRLALSKTNSTVLLKQVCFSISQQYYVLCATKYLRVPNNLSWQLFVCFNCECSEEQLRGWLHFTAEDKVGWKHSLSSDCHQPGSLLQSPRSPLLLVSCS